MGAGTVNCPSKVAVGGLCAKTDMLTLVPLLL